MGQGASRPGPEAGPERGIALLRDFEAVGLGYVLGPIDRPTRMRPATRAALILVGVSCAEVVTRRDPLQLWSAKG